MASSCWVLCESCPLTKTADSNLRIQCDRREHLSTDPCVLVLASRCFRYVYPNPPTLPGRFDSSAIKETIAPATVWSVIECGVAIICACLPNLAPGLRMIWTRCHHCCCWNRDTGTSSEDLVHGLRLQPVPPEQTKLEERVARSSGEDTVNGSLPI